MKLTIYKIDLKTRKMTWDV